MNENERGGCTAEHGSNTAGPKTPLNWRLREAQLLLRSTIWEMA